MHDDSHVLGWLLTFPACSPTFKPTLASVHTQLASVGRFLHLVTRSAARHLQCHTPHRRDMPTCWFQLLPIENVNSPINLKSSIRVVWIVIKIWNFEPQYTRSPVCNIKVLLRQMHTRVVDIYRDLWMPKMCFLVLFAVTSLSCDIWWYLHDTKYWHHLFARLEHGITPYEKIPI